MSKETNSKKSKRYCFGCKTTLSYEDYCDDNKAKPLKSLERLWESPHIELYCCIYLINHFYIIWINNKKFNKRKVSFLLLCKSLYCKEPRLWFN